MFSSIIVTTLLKILFLIHSTECFAPVSSKMFYAYQRSLIHSMTSNNYNQTTIVSFYEAHPSYSTAKTGILLSGIVNNQPNQCSFSFDSTFINSTAATLQVYFPFAANIVEITLTLIITYVNGTGVFEISTYSFNQYIISNITPGISTLKTHTTTVTNPFSHAIFLRSFNLTQNLASNLSITIVDSTIVSTNPIKYNYKVEFGTTIRQIALTIIVYKKNLTSISNYSRYNIYTFTSNTYNNNLNNVNIFLLSSASYGYQGKCLVGHNKLNFNSNFALSFKFSNATFNYTNVPNLQIWMFCIVENYDCTLIDPKCVYCKSKDICTLCSTSYIPVFYTNYSSKCKQCSQLIPGCLSCFTQYQLNQKTIINCTSCEIPTYLLKDSNCSLCNYTFPYCLQCTPTNCSTCIAPFMLKDGYCKTCTQVLRGCVQCNSVTQCTKCYEGFVLWQGQCKSCHTCYGCIVFTINAQGDIKCLKCNNTMFLQNPVDNLCVCINGRIQNRICNTDSGCIAPYLSNGVVSCLFCNFTANFKMQPGNSGLCQCSPKYVLNGNGDCVDLCGDGFLMLNYTTYCDDGNLVSGDGCSSTCNVEMGFSCTNGNNFTPSTCIYLGSQPYIILKNIERVQGSNTGTFQFIVEPALSALGKLNMMNSLILNCSSAQYTVTNASQKKGRITISVDFSTDLEGLSCSLTLNYDQTLVAYQNSVLNFQAISRNIPLKVSHRIGSYNIIEFIFGMFSYISLGLFIISLGHKMIGAEILLCSQMIYLSNCFNDKSSFMMSSIKSLKLVTGGWSLFRQDTDKQLAYPFSDRVEISKRFLETNIFVVCVMLLLGLICIAYLIHKFVTRQKKINQIEIISIKTFKVYRYFLMPICASFMLMLFLSAFISQTKNSLNTKQIVSPEVNSVLIFFAMSFCGMVAALQIHSTLSKARKGQEQSQETVLFEGWYPSLFLLQIILLSLLIQFGIKFNGQIVSFIILCLKLGYLILLLIKLPYKRTLDMVNIVICQVIVLYALCINMVKNYIQVDQAFQAPLIFILQGFMVICYTLGIARLTIDYYRTWLEKYNKIKEKSSSNNFKSQNDIQKQIMKSSHQNHNEENVVGKASIQDEFRELQAKKYNKYSLMNLYETKNIKIKEDSINKEKLQLNISKANEDQHLSVLKQKLRQNLFKKKMKK